MLTQDDVLYMIVTDRFCDGDSSNDVGVDKAAPLKWHGGDLWGIVQRMPYLRDLGVTAIWITPVYLNPPEDYHGYHPLDFEEVDPHLCSDQLGTGNGRSRLKRFIEIAHENGLKVMLDLIITHTAATHPWLKEHPEWFYPRGSMEPEKWWIWGLPHLNHDNPEVILYFEKNVLDWIADTGADAIRIDAARHVERRFWSVFKLFAKGIYPTVTVVGEVWDDSPAVVAPYQNMYGFDSMFDYPLYDAIIDVFARDHGFYQIARPQLADDEPDGVLNKDYAYRNAYELLTFIGNHDNPRFLQMSGGPNFDPLRMKLALSFLFTTRGIPQLYYGDELGMLGGPDPDNRRDMRWDLVDDETLESEEALRARDLRKFVKRLIAIRRGSKALCYGLLTTLFVTGTIYAYIRIFFDEVMIVVLNNSAESAALIIPILSNSRLSPAALKLLHEGANLKDQLDESVSVVIQDGNIQVSLPARSPRIFSSK